MNPSPAAFGPDPDRGGAALHRALSALPGAVVAFSGGVDSTYLLFAAVRALGPERVLAATVDAPYVPRAEIAAAVELARGIGAAHRLIPMAFPGVLRANPPERCYLCKGLAYARIMDLAGACGSWPVLDGSNRDDLDEHRPGFAALAELGVPSPLLDAGLAKAAIRELSRRHGLPTADKPAMACLLTRLPHGAAVDGAVLARIEGGEEILREMGFAGARLRLHGDVARIEVPAPRIPELVAASGANDLPGRLARLGIRHTAVDLLGYRTGSLGNGKD